MDYGKKQTYLLHASSGIRTHEPPRLLCILITIDFLKYNHMIDKFYNFRSL